MERNIEKHYKGLNTDFHPLEQPEGTYRYCINGVIQRGDKLFISTEQANIECGNLEGYTLIGHVYLENNTFAIFLTNGITSRISLLENCSITTLVENTCLGFNVKSQVEAKYRKRLGCERIIYFTDNLNPLRYYNLDREELFYTTEYEEYLENGDTNPYTGEIWDCNKFLLIPEYNIPCFSNAEIISGGILKPGKYFFAIQYLTEDLNPTNWIYDSNGINIFHDELTGNYESIQGSSNYSENTLAGKVEPTSKAIKLNVSSLDTRFRYYRIAIIEFTSGTGNISNSYSSPQIPITSDEFIFDGNLQGYASVTIEEILQPREDIEKAAHIEQLENRLIVANTKGKEVNFCNFQRFASKISSKYVVKSVPVQEVDISGNPKNPLTPFDSMSFLGGEVYAFGIVYIFRDGFESPVYHIPGTYKNTRYNPDTQSCIVVDDTSVIPTWNENIEHLVPSSDAATYNALPDSQKIPKWRVEETAISIDANSGYLAYWENTGNSIYPNIRTCDNSDYWGVDACGNSLTDTPVRHHRFPSRELVPHIQQGTTATSEVQLLLTVTLNDGEIFPSPDPTVQVDYDLNGIAQTPYTQLITSSDVPIENQVIITIPNADEGDITNITISGLSSEFTSSVTLRTLNTRYSDTTTVELLGIEFDNIEYPSDDIVGHYFVRGERDNINRTIIDKGIANRLREKSTSSFDYTTFSYFTNNNNAPNDIYTFTPNYLFEDSKGTPEYIKIENSFNFNNKILGSERYDGVGSIFKETDTIIEHRTQYYSGLIFSDSDKNRSVNKARSFDGLSFDTAYLPGRKFYNLSHTNRLLTYNLESSFPNLGNNIAYVSLRRDINIHPSLENIRYIRMHNCMLTNDTTSEIYGGDIYISHMNMSNTLFREFFQSPLSAIFTAIAIVGAAVAVVATAGTAGAAVAGIASAIGIATSASTITTAITIAAIIAGTIGVTSQAVRAVAQAYAETDLDELAEDNELDALRTPATSTVSYANEHISGTYVESEINVGLRQNENHLCGDYFRYNQYIGE
jgi:hypothetical protein